MDLPLTSDSGAEPGQRKNDRRRASWAPSTLSVAPSIGSSGTTDLPSRSSRCQTRRTTFTNVDMIASSLFSQTEDAWNSIHKGGDYSLVASDEENIQATSAQKQKRAGIKLTAQHKPVGIVMLNSVQFQSVMALVIISNSIVIGMETDFPHWARWDMIENGFLAVFFVELAVRLFVIGPLNYFHIENPDIVWNVLDSSIVSLGVMDALVALCNGSSKSGGFATIFRIIRLLRILRIFRIVRFLKQLYMLAFGFALAAEAVFWVAILMAFMLYTWSIILVRTVGQLSDDHAHAAFLRKKFGTIVQSMLTLFELISQPNIEPYTPVLSSYLPLTGFLIVFIIFGSFGMIALLTGVISESMFSKNEIRQEEARSVREANRQILIKSVEDLFDSFQKDSVGEVSFSRIQSQLPQVKEMFDRTGVEIGDQDLEDMLDCIDADGSGGVSQEEFIAGIVQLVDGVRPMLILQVHYGVQFVKRETEKFLEESRTIRSKLDDLIRETLDISRKIDSQKTQIPILPPIQLQEGERVHSIWDSCGDGSTESSEISASSKASREPVSARLSDPCAKHPCGGSLASSGSHVSGHSRTGHKKPAPSTNEGVRLSDESCDYHSMPEQGVGSTLLSERLDLSTTATQKRHIVEKEDSDAAVSGSKCSPPSFKIILPPPPAALTELLVPQEKSGGRSGFSEIASGSARNSDLGEIGGIVAGRAASCSHSSGPCVNESGTIWACTGGVGDGDGSQKLSSPANTERNARITQVATPSGHLNFAEDLGHDSNEKPVWKSDCSTLDSDERLLMTLETRIAAAAGVAAAAEAKKIIQDALGQWFPSRQVEKIM